MRTDRFMNTKTISRIIVALSFSFIALPFFSTHAKEKSTVISPEIFEAKDPDKAFNFSSAKRTDAKQIGTLSVNGENYTLGTLENLTDISVKKDYSDQGTDYNLTISFSPNNIKKQPKSKWHLVDCDDKKIDIISLNEKINKGALIIQTSKDNNSWVTVYSITNVFGAQKKGKTDYYRTTDIQLVNGCYYRVIVAYELRKKTKPSKILFIKKDNYKYRKVVEVYSFHALEEAAKDKNTDSNTPKYNLGSRVRTKKFDGYAGKAKMKKEDPHYGWDLGQFFVCGYTDTALDKDGNVVFLKNVGDQVVLWFNLLQNLNKLNGDKAISIMADPAGYDQYFETNTMDFGLGALIIRSTNDENVKSDPIIYKNYLLASASPGANTKVNLFEEGDYEVALDYAIKNDKTIVFGKSILPGESHYRIFFQFSVRNSNSMFFPRDLKTKSELPNNAITPNGFYLDLAGSKYLDLSYIREVLIPGENIVSEDIRENKVAKDGDSFTKEGIYTITVKNPTTGNETTKKIYVGDDEILKAYMVTGLSITEIQDRVSNGSIILDDGTINNPTTTGSVQSSDDQTAELNIEESSTEQSSSEKLTLTNSN